MEYNTPEVKRTVFDYEFVFSSGMGLAITVDPEAGDSIEYLDGIIHIKLAAKPGLSDSSQSQGSEDHTIFLKHVASNIKRERTVVELTPEQKEVWKKVYKEVSNSVH